MLAKKKIYLSCTETKVSCVHLHSETETNDPLFMYLALNIKNEKKNSANITVCIGFVPYAELRNPEIYQTTNVNWNWFCETEQETHMPYQSYEYHSLT